MAVLEEIHVDHAAVAAEIVLQTNEGCLSVFGQRQPAASRQAFCNPAVGRKLQEKLSVVPSSLLGMARSKAEQLLANL